MDPITLGALALGAIWGACAKHAYDYITDDDYRDKCDQKYERKVRAEYEEYLEYCKKNNHESPMSFSEFYEDYNDYVEDGGDRVS